MMDLPFGTHRGLIEPLSERRHLQKTFVRRFLVISQLSVSDADKLPYHDLAEDEDWRTGMLQHILKERRQGPLDRDDLEWLDYLCCQ